MEAWGPAPTNGEPGVMSKKQWIGASGAVVMAVTVMVTAAVEASGLTPDQEIAERMLNQWSHSLIAIREHADPLVLKSEYEQAFANVRADALPDGIREFHLQIMAALTSEQIDALNQSHLESLLARKTERSLLEVVHDSLGGGVRSALYGNPSALLEPLSGGVSGCYSYYDKVRAAQEEHDESIQEMKVAMLERCNTLCSEFLEVRVELARQLDLDETRRPQPSDLRSMQRALGMSDPKRRHARLEGLRDNPAFRSLGPYWFHLGMAREAIGDPTGAMAAYSHYIDELPAIHLIRDDLQAAARAKRTSLAIGAVQAPLEERVFPEWVDEDVEWLVAHASRQWPVHVDLQVASILALLDPGKWKLKINEIIAYWKADENEQNRSLARTVELVLAAQVQTSDPSRLTRLLKDLAAESQEAVHDLQLLYVMTRDERAISRLKPVLQSMSLQVETELLGWSSYLVLTMPGVWHGAPGAVTMEVEGKPTAWSGTATDDGVVFEDCVLDPAAWRSEAINEVVITVPVGEATVALHYRVLHRFHSEPEFVLWWYDTGTHRYVRARGAFRRTSETPAMSPFQRIAGPLMELTFGRPGDGFLRDPQPQSVWVDGPDALHLGNLSATGSAEVSTPTASPDGRTRYQLTDVFFEPDWDQSHKRLSVRLGEGVVAHCDARSIVEDTYVTADQISVESREGNWRMRGLAWALESPLDACLRGMEGLQLRRASRPADGAPDQRVEGLEVVVPVTPASIEIRVDGSPIDAEGATADWMQTWWIPAPTGTTVSIVVDGRCHVDVPINEVLQRSLLVLEQLDLKLGDKVYHWSGTEWISATYAHEGDDT